MDRVNSFTFEMREGKIVDGIEVKEVFRDGETLNEREDSCFLLVRNI